MMARGDGLHRRPHCTRGGARRIAVLSMLLFLGCSAATADDIYLARGRFFSVFVPGACDKEQQEAFALTLRCKLQGKLVSFYLKEFPGQLDEQFDAHKNPPTAEHAEAYEDAALRSILDELDPEMRPRVKIFSSGAALGYDNRARFWWDGYVSNVEVVESNPQKPECVFVEVLLFLKGYSAVLVGLSESDGLSRYGQLKCLGVPEEASAILESFDAMSKGFRFRHIRR
jgi:hypothetical protein